MKLTDNYRIDVFMENNAHYKITFPEYWLAMTFANAVKTEKSVKSVFLLERISDKSFDITRKIL